MSNLFSMEWLNANLSRAYPLDDSTGGAEGTLPSSLLVDAKILYDSVEIYDAYISHVSITEVGWTLSISCMYRSTDGTEQPAVFNDLVAVPYDTERNGVVKFAGAVDGVAISGSITVGDATAIAHWSPETDLDISNGRLAVPVLVHMDELCVTAIKVGNTVLSGTVELVAGPGISFTVDESTNTLVIENYNYAIPEGNLDVVDDNSLIDNLVSRYGRPITSINGVAPGNLGDISFLVPVTEAEDTDYHIAVDSAGPGTVSLKLHVDPTVDAGVIDSLSEGLEQLNERASRLDTGIKEVDTAINGVATQLTRLS